MTTQTLEKKTHVITAIHSGKMFEKMFDSCSSFMIIKKKSLSKLGIGYFLNSLLKS